MAQLYSTALVNRLTGGRSVRSILDNCILQIYSGAAPATADEAATGTLLVTVSKSSGIYGATGATAEPSLESWYFGFDPAMGPTGGNTVMVAISLDGVNATYTHTINGTYATGPFSFSEAVAREINKAGRDVWAIGCPIPTGASGEARVVVSPVVRGLGMTLANGGGNNTIYPVKAIANVRPSSLQLGPPAAGVVSKLSGDTWTGVNLANGVGGYFRLTLVNDSTIADGNLVYPRVQGSVGTSGADLNLDSVQFVAGATTTISSFSIQEPMSA